MMLELARYYPILLVMAGAILFGLISGCMGAFTLIRKQGLVGDSMSHAALAGITTIFYFTGSTSPMLLLVGGSIAGLLALGFIALAESYNFSRRDALLAVVIAIFFGYGLIMMTVIQKSGLIGQGSLGKFLFGNISTLLAEDVLLMSGVALVVMCGLIIFWRAFFAISFDREYVSVIGWPIFLLDMVFYILLMMLISAGLYMTGIILMASLLISPAAAARQWTSNPYVYVITSALFGGLSAGVGSFISLLLLEVPTGPVIVLSATVFVLLSLVVAPHRGLWWQWRR